MVEYPLHQHTGNHQDLATWGVGWPYTDPLMMVVGTTTTYHFQMMCGCNIGWQLPLFWQQWQWGWQQYWCWCIHSLVLWFLVMLDMITFIIFAQIAVLKWLSSDAYPNCNVALYWITLMTTMMFILALLSPIWLLVLAMALVLALAIYINNDHVGVNHVAFHWLWCCLVLKLVIVSMWWLP